MRSHLRPRLQRPAIHHADTASLMPLLQPLREHLLAQKRSEGDLSVWMLSGPAECRGSTEDPGDTRIEGLEGRLRVDFERECVHVVEVDVGETRVHECLDAVQGLDANGDEDWVSGWGPFLAEESGLGACAGVRALEPAALGLGGENVCVDVTVVVIDLQDGYADRSARQKRQIRQRAFSRVVD